MVTSPKELKRLCKGKAFTLEGKASSWVQTGTWREGKCSIKSAEEWTSTILPGLLEEYRPNEV